MLAGTSRLVVSPKVLSRALGEETVLLDLATERYLGLDASGTDFWNALTREPSLDAAFARLAAELDVEPGRLRADLLAFAEKLVGEGLATVEERAVP